VGLRGHKEPWISADSVIWRNVICHPSVFGRTAWFRQNPYDPRYDGSEDYELWCRTLTKSRMAIIQEPLLFYRESGSYSLKKYLRYQWVGMRVKWRHGPEQVGYAGTAMLIAKALIQSATHVAASAVRMERHLLQLRSMPVSGERYREA